jgi:hypothetical protein
MGRCVYTYILRAHHPTHTLTRNTQHTHKPTSHFRLAPLHNIHQILSHPKNKLFHIDKNIYLYNLADRTSYRIFIINKKIMKSLSAFLASCIIWYAIISFINFNVYVETWHWAARASFVILSLLTWDRVDKNI